MKSLFKIISCAMLIALFFISSCSKDEDGFPINTIRYNGENYKLEFAFGLNYGSFQEGSVTYNNTDFLFFDRVIDPDDNNSVYEFGLYLELYSGGNANFQGGTFTYYSGSGSIPTGSFFTNGTLFFFDENKDPIEFTGGTITVTITGSKYSFVFEVTTNEGKKLEGNYSGEIEINNIGAPNISGNIVVGGGSRSADFGEVLDYGANSTHHNYDFIIYDTDDTYELYFEAFSLGTTGFQAGTFTYGTTGANYFDIIEYFDYETFSDYNAVSGSVVITKLSGTREYRLQFNVVLDDESTLTGTVEGDFRYSNIGGRMGRVKKESSSEYFNVKKSSVKRVRK
ncbi:MAG: hypothetical protein KF846_01790 [Cyclobacteriaceae bacterium]|nr:hypothetical protein [Cyclobacteriaceae bacterium]